MASMKCEDTADHKCLVMMSSHICGVISLRVSTSSRISLRALSNSSFYRKQDFWGRRSIRDSLKGPNYFGAWRRRDLHATGRNGISTAYDIPTKLWRQSIIVTLVYVLILIGWNCSVRFSVTSDDLPKSINSFVECLYAAGLFYARCSPCVKANL